MSTVRPFCGVLFFRGALCLELKNALFVCLNINRGPSFIFANTFLCFLGVRPYNFWVISVLLRVHDFGVISLLSFGTVVLRFFLFFNNNTGFLWFWVLLMSIVFDHYR